MTESVHYRIQSRRLVFVIHFPVHFSSGEGCGGSSPRKTRDT